MVVITCPLVGIGLTNLPKSGGSKFDPPPCPLVSPGPCRLLEGREEEDQLRYPNNASPKRSFIHCPHNGMKYILNLGSYI